MNFDNDAILTQINDAVPDPYSGFLGAATRVVREVLPASVRLIAEDRRYSDEYVGIVVRAWVAGRAAKETT